NPLRERPNVDAKGRTHQRLLLPSYSITQPAPARDHRAGALSRYPSLCPPSIIDRPQLTPPLLPSLAPPRATLAPCSPGSPTCSRAGSARPPSAPPPAPASSTHAASAASRPRASSSPNSRASPGPVPASTLRASSICSAASAG